MKYIILTIQQDDLKKELPVIFPDMLVHSDIADYIKRDLAMEHEIFDAQVVSAGFCNLFGEIKCYGKSESLKIKSRKEQDEQLIKFYDYNHGYV